MNLLELLVVLMYIGLAAVVGGITKGIGAPVIMLAALFIVSIWFRRTDRIHPPCHCGRSNWDQFKGASIAGYVNVWQCMCGKYYSWPRSGLWYEIADGGVARLYMKRNVFRRWVGATERDIANNELQPGSKA